MEREMDRIVVPPNLVETIKMAKETSEKLQREAVILREGASISQRLSEVILENAIMHVAITMDISMKRYSLVEHDGQLVFEAKEDG
jgi:hypothetical protein